MEQGQGSIERKQEELPDSDILDAVTLWDYRRAMEFMDEVSRLGSRLGLTSMRLLLYELSNPQDKLSVIHVAGTNGKGSICTFLESCYRKAGYLVGRYSSPGVFSHLECFQINGAAITEEEFTACSWTVYKAYRRMKAKGLLLPTVFELQTAIAFVYFLEKQADLVVLETGMGGSEDATNVVQKPLVTVFSSISMDHQEFLGKNLADIARVKAGIMREKVPVVAAPMELEAEKVLSSQAERLHSSLYLPKPGKCSFRLGETTFTYKQEAYEISLAGTYQPENAVCALAVVDILSERFPVSMEEKKEGMRRASWQGRFEVMQTAPVIIRDGAHNVDAVKRLAETLKLYFPNQEISFVMGVFQDKDYPAMIEQILPLCKRVYTVTPLNPERALAKELLAQCFISKQQESGRSFPVQCMDSVIQAEEAFIGQAGKDEVLVIFGSLSLSALCKE